MGCDEHTTVEGKIKGEWVFLGSINLGRDYTLFGVLAGVRNEEVECVSGEAKGLPEDCTTQIQTISDNWGVDGHSHSYLNYDELMEAKEIFDSYLKDSEYKRDFPFALTELKTILDLPFIEDVRIVFWFDN